MLRPEHLINRREFTGIVFAVSSYAAHESKITGHLRTRKQKARPQIHDISHTLTITPLQDMPPESPRHRDHSPTPYAIRHRTYSPIIAAENSRVVLDVVVPRLRFGVIRPLVHVVADPGH